MASGRTIWADQLQRTRAIGLWPGRDALERQPDVLVVGGGIVGVATALACHQAGIGRVSLVEAGAARLRSYCWCGRLIGP